jgi:FtsZ-interacting cell division protein YlmF
MNTMAGYSKNGASTVSNVRAFTGHDSRANLVMQTHPEIYVSVSVLSTYPAKYNDITSGEARLRDIISI